jgi:Zn ribbon nucleic-acid-binding protein
MVIGKNHVLNVQKDIKLNTQKRMFGQWRKALIQTYENNLTKEYNGFKATLKISIPDNNLNTRVHRAEAIFELTRLVNSLMEEAAEELERDIPIRIAYMSLIQRRKDNGAVCPKCKHPDYSMIKPIEGITTKYEFRCTKCSKTWQYGKDGGKYAKFFKAD